MVQAGARDNCVAAPEVMAEAEALLQRQQQQQQGQQQGQQEEGQPPPEALPGPGAVDLLVGGPPCQGFSGMNRDNGSEGSVLKKSMVRVCMCVCMCACVSVCGSVRAWVCC